MQEAAVIKINLGNSPGIFLTNVVNTVKATTRRVEFEIAVYHLIAGKFQQVCRIAPASHFISAVIGFSGVRGKNSCDNKIEQVLMSGSRSDIANGLKALNS